MTTASADATQSRAAEIGASARDGSRMLMADSMTLTSRSTSASQVSSRTDTACRRVSAFRFSGSSDVAGIAAPSTSTGTTRTLGPRQRRADFEAHEVERLVEAAAAGEVARAGPFAANHGQHHRAVGQARLDGLDEVLAWAQRVHVTEHAGGAQSPLERLAQPPGVARRVFAAVTDEGSGHASPWGRTGPIIPAALPSSVAIARLAHLREGHRMLKACATRSSRPRRSAHDGRPQTRFCSASITSTTIRGATIGWGPTRRWPVTTSARTSRARTAGACTTATSSRVFPSIPTAGSRR